MERLWALLREVAWSSVLSIVLLIAGIVVGLVAPDYLGLTLSLVGGSMTLAVLALRS